jgi:hypothetical protein
LATKQSGVESQGMIFGWLLMLTGNAFCNQIIAANGETITKKQHRFQLINTYIIFVELWTFC